MGGVTDKPILVTGAGGYLGRHVVAALRQQGAVVRAMTRTPSPVGEAAAPLPEGQEHTAATETVQADLLNPETLPPALENVHVVVHLAAKMDGPPQQVRDETVRGTQHLLEALAGTQVRRLVLASSLSVYDFAQVHGQLTEDSPLAAMPDAPNLAYAAAKLEQERLAVEAAQRLGLELVILRPGGIWGDGRHADYLVGRRIGPLQVVVSPRARIRLAHVQRVAEAFALAATRPVAERTVYNLLDPMGPTAWDYARRLGGLRVPLPYRVGWTLSKLAWWAAGLAGQRRRVPDLLVPASFEARFKPLRWPDDRLRDEPTWAPERERTSSPPAEAGG